MTRSITEILAFHDERWVRRWLYHGFILCEIGSLSSLREALVEAKRKANCNLGKRIHFSELRSSSHGSSRTRTAVNWAGLFVTTLYQHMWFYLFGVNLKNINYQFFGPASDRQHRHSRIYNRFFEIGLFS